MMQFLSIALVSAAILGDAPSPTTPVQSQVRVDVLQRRANALRAHEGECRRIADAFTAMRDRCAADMERRSQLSSGDERHLTPDAYRMSVRRLNDAWFSYRSGVGFPVFPAFQQSAEDKTIGALDTEWSRSKRVAITACEEAIAASAKDDNVLLVAQLTRELRDFVTRFDATPWTDILNHDVRFPSTVSWTAGPAQSSYLQPSTLQGGATNPIEFGRMFDTTRYEVELGLICSPVFKSCTLTLPDASGSPRSVQIDAARMTSRTTTIVHATVTSDAVVIDVNGERFLELSTLADSPQPRTRGAFRIVSDSPTAGVKIVRVDERAFGNTARFSMPPRPRPSAPRPAGN